MASRMRAQSHRETSSLGDAGLRMGVGRCFGTFGELLQGVLPDEGRNFLVTLPIGLYSSARFTALPGCRELHVFPAYKVKARQLAERLLGLFDLPTGGVLCLRSELAEGKGCASSSADMVAAAQALRSAFDLTLPPTLLAPLMASIEPSDGVMYRGIVSFYHREGMLRNFLGRLPPLTIIALDEGGQVDTVAFNRRAGSRSADEQREYAALLLALERAVVSGDLRAVGEVATSSAILNQRILPKAHLDLLIDLRERHDALGVVAAHSGTYVGLLLDPAAPSYPRALPAIAAELARHSPDVGLFHTLDFRKESSDHAL